jgi:hypothetical protein
VAARNCEWKRFNTEIIGLGSLKFSLVSRLNKKFESLCSVLEWDKCSYHSVMDDDGDDENYDNDDDDDDEDNGDWQI